MVNADSMQVYGVLRVLTARPSPREAANPPHHLYGHVDPATPYSAGAWLRDVETLAGSGLFERRRPVFVGGTGLYFRALTEGLADLPPVPDAIRRKWRDALRAEGPAALHQVLANRDPAAARSIRPSDGQRIARALEVCEASGQRFSHLQARGGKGLADGGTMRGIVLEPARPVLHARIEARLLRMVEEGALDEVKALISRRLDPSLPAMKAIGVREFAAHLSGEIGLDEAVRLAATATRQYAKRQSTWFRGQARASWMRAAEPPEALAMLESRGEFT